MIRRLFVGVTALWLAAMLVIYSDAGSGVIGMFAFEGGVVALGGVVVVQLMLRVLERRRSVPDRRYAGRWPCGVVDSCGVVYAPSGSPRRWMEDQFTSLHGAWWHVFEGF